MTEVHVRPGVTPAAGPTNEGTDEYLHDFASLVNAGAFAAADVCRQRGERPSLTTSRPATLIS